MATKKTVYPCPCFSGKRYDACCEKIHKNNSNATAEQIMRARYTAYCYGNIPFLVDTLHPQMRRLGDAFSLSRLIKKTQWVGFKFIKEKVTDKATYLNFVAFRLEQEEIKQQHESARFVRVKDKWYYVDSELLPDIKLERNAPCFCGSGKKYKKCHDTLAGKISAK